MVLLRKAEVLRDVMKLGSGDGPLSVRGCPSTVKGALLRFLRKWPMATLDRGASAPLRSATEGQARACPDRTRAIPCKGEGIRSRNIRGMIFERAGQQTANDAGHSSMSEHSASDLENR